jgi:hypothetical protein
MGRDDFQWPAIILTEESLWDFLETLMHGKATVNSVS